MQTIQMHLFQKQNGFVNYLMHFPNLHQILNNFKKRPPS